MRMEEYMSHKYISMLFLFTAASLIWLNTAGYADPAGPGANSEDNAGYSVLKLKEPVFPNVPKDWHVIVKTSENCFTLCYVNARGDQLIFTLDECNRRPATSLQHTKSTTVNRTTYYYDPWISSQRGWMVRWNKGDVYFEMNSFSLNVPEMIRIAETVSAQVVD
ncbi:DUF4367 domain-containing protein [Paenibacillus campinasensis]|uniref:DUF4367 domain-containing protein n=2 Tax=Paenibacillus campinasensis TaxID=66347 RepID=A0ABW9T6F2_9BACL|nr:DUF4367 domain-containing protein [Paenibacillus campinasensis]